MRQIAAHIHNDKRAGEWYDKRAGKMVLKFHTEVFNEIKMQLQKVMMSVWVSIDIDDNNKQYQ